MKENRGEIVEEEGPVEYNPDERDYRAEWYKVQCNEDIHGASKDWKGHDPDIPEPSDFVEELLDTLDQQKKELDKSIRNEAHLIEHLSLKEIVFDQLYKKHDTLCKAYEVQEEENLKNLKRLEKERDSANERVWAMQDIVTEYMWEIVDLRKERDARYSLEEIKEAYRAILHQNTVIDRQPCWTPDHKQIIEYLTSKRTEKEGGTDE